jgi:hypothetical protein
MAWKRKKRHWRWCNYPLSGEKRFRKVHIEVCRWHIKEDDENCQRCDYFSEERETYQRQEKKVVHSNASMFGVRDEPGRGVSSCKKVNGPWA